MTALPALILRAPKILYLATALFFIASIVLNHLELESTMEFARSGDPLVRSARLRAIYQGGLDAAFLAANGVIVHVLLAIWQKGPEAPETAND